MEWEKAWVTTRLCKNKPSPKRSHLLGVWLVAAAAVAAARGLTRAKGKGHRLWSICWLRASDPHLCAVRDSSDDSTQWKWTSLSCRSAFLLFTCAPRGPSWAYGSRPAGLYGQSVYTGNKSSTIANWIKPGINALMHYRSLCAHIISTKALVLESFLSTPHSTSIPLHFRWKYCTFFFLLHCVFWRALVTYFKMKALHSKHMKSL